MRPDLHHDERGHSMMEFLLVLPFLFIIFALSADFAAVMIGRQRTKVAVREIAVRQMMSRSSQSEVGLDAIARDVAADVLEPAKLKLESFRGSSTGGGESVDGMGAQEEGLLGGLMSKVSSTQEYEIRGSRPLPFGSLLRTKSHAEKLWMDSYPWTYYEIPSLWNLLGSKVPANLGETGIEL